MVEKGKVERGSWLKKMVGIVGVGMVFLVEEWCGKVCCCGDVMV